MVELAVGRRASVAYDAQSMVGVSHDIVNHFSLQASGGFADYLHLSTPYSPYGIGISLLAVPLYAVSKVIGHEAALLSIINPLLVSATVVTGWAVGRRLGWRESLAVLGAIVFGTFSMALQATTEIFSEPAVGLCLALLVWGVLRWRDGEGVGALIVGLSAGAVVQFRADSVVTVWIGLLALPLFVPWRTIVRPVCVAALAIPMGLSLAAIGAYNFLRWHSVLAFSYNGQGFHTPLLHGLDGLLLSPGKSVFVYNPVALLGIVGLIILCWTNLPVATLFLLLIVPRLLFFSRWDAWEGGVDWGPRFLMPVVLLFVLAAIEVLHRTRMGTSAGVVTRVAFIVLCVLGAGISFLSVRVPFEQWEKTVTSPGAETRYGGGRPFAVPATPTSLERAYDFTFRASQVRGDFELLVRGDAVMAPAFFRQGDAAVGALLVLLGGVGLSVAGAVAVDVDRSRRRPLGDDSSPMLTSEEIEPG